MRGIEQLQRLDHPLDTPVGRVVVGVADDVDPHGGDLLRHARIGEHPGAARFGLRRSLEGRKVERGRLEIAEGHIGAAQDAEHIGRLLFERRQHRAQIDEVADGGEAEIARDRRAGDRRGFERFAAARLGLNRKPGQRDHGGPGERQQAQRPEAGKGTGEMDRHADAPLM